MKRITLIICCILFTYQMLQAQSKKEINLQGWLTVNELAIRKPAFDTVKNLKGESFDQQKLLSYPFVNISELHPAEGETMNWWGKSLKWTKTSPDSKGFAGLAKPVKTPSLAIYNTYFYNSTYQKVQWIFESPLPFEVYLDGVKLTDKKSVEADTVAPGSAKKDFTLEEGSHQLVIKVLYPENTSAELKVKASIKVDSIKEQTISMEAKAQQYMDLDHYLTGTIVGSPKISFDGKYYALSFRNVDNPDGKGRMWVEIRRTADHALIQNFRDARNLTFSQKSNQFVYQISQQKKQSLFLYDIEKQKETLLLEDEIDLSSFAWSPDENFLILSVKEEAEKNSSGVKKLEALPDRWPDFRNRTNLVLFDLKSKIQQPLTFGYLSCILNDISHDSKRILFSTSEMDYGNRPYTKQKMYVMHLENGNIELLWDQSFSGSASFSPDDKTLLVIGSAAMFNNLGSSLPSNVLVNDYNTQAFLFDIASKKATAISKDFNPKINEGYWDASGKIIYFVAENGFYVNLYQYDIANGKYKMIPTNADVIQQVGFSATKPMVVYSASSAQVPLQAFLLDLKKNQNTVISAPKQAFFKNIVFGKMEKWNDTTANGVIEGAYYLPPNFDPAKKYPMIVYYYGGTSPTALMFDARYPRNYWAAQGYVVYVLNPSGCTGYGQEFAARHVNNWGITVADEIINTTKKFTATHDFIDASKIGCIGASYGGFMTQLLQTRTDIFAAAISHAGISSLSSYWGEGFWGYLYSSVASANSFPWNNPKLYIDQSPLFHADKINTPLLLLHGTSDVNVPQGESIQMYTALKLLGKPVEFVQVDGEDHGIVDYKKRLVWEKTILAWFEKYLKGNTEYWDALYPPKDL